MKVGIVFRPRHQAAAQLAKKVCEWLKKRKMAPVIGPSCPRVLGVPQVSSLKKTDLLVVLGGDGTYLRAARDIEGTPIPVLGVNLGSLGFLTTTRVESVFESLERAIHGKMTIEKRTLLVAQFKKKSWLALNDVVIERGAWSQLINLEIRTEDHLVTEVKADGLIVSTPTGSTAYNLAAGGPILSPLVEAITITPVSAHSLTHRPMIFPQSTQLRLKLGESEQKSHIIVDGHDQGQMRSGDEIRISVSDKKHFALRDPGHDYFAVLREKLSFGVRI